MDGADIVLSLVTFRKEIKQVEYEHSNKKNVVAEFQTNVKPVLTQMRGGACEDAAPNGKIKDGHEDNEYHAALHANYVQ